LRRWRRARAFPLASPTNCLFVGPSTRSKNSRRWGAPKYPFLTASWPSKSGAEMGPSPPCLATAKPVLGEPLTPLPNLVFPGVYPRSRAPLVRFQGGVGPEKSCNRWPRFSRHSDQLFCLSPPIPAKSKPSAAEFLTSRAECRWLRVRAPRKVEWTPQAPRSPKAPPNTPASPAGAPSPEKAPFQKPRIIPPPPPRPPRPPPTPEKVRRPPPPWAAPGKVRAPKKSSFFFRSTLFFRKKKPGRPINDEDRPAPTETDSFFRPREGGGGQSKKLGSPPDRPRFFPFL